MSWRRKAVYLTLIAPLHHLGLVLASIGPALLLPAKPFLQIALIAPVFAALVWWAVPKFQRLMGLYSAKTGFASLRIPAVFAAIGINGLAIVAVFFGYTTPVEATILGALFLTALHAWLTRTL